MDFHNVSCFQKGNQLRKEGRFEEAIAEYRNAISAVEQPLHQVYVELGYLLTVQHKLDEALSCYLTAIDLKPEFWPAHGKLRRSQWTSIQADKILQKLKQVIESKPNSIFPYMSLGYLLARQGQTSDAVTYLEKASDCNASKLNSSFRIDSHVYGIRKPNFIIIGSAKSGTTSLYNYLLEHDLVLPAVTKEIGYFDTKRYSNGTDWYLSHFPKISDNEEYITGEATPSYLHRYGVPERLFELFPDIKLIAVLRNPINRTVSAYHHSVKDNGERRSLKEVIDSEINLVQGMIDPSEIMNPSNRVKMKYRFEPRYVVWGLYYYFLKKWMDIFTQEQFLILNSEDFYSNTSDAMNKVFNFLKLPNCEITEYRKYTVGRYDSIDDDLKNKLSDFFKPHNEKLEELIGCQLNWN